MQLFQNSSIYPSYLPRLRQLMEGATTFEQMVKRFLEDRFGALHFLKPVLDSAPEAFFTNGDDEVVQHAWAREHGMQRSSSLADILLAQIEEHKTEVFYNLDPIRYGDQFVSRLPGCVRKTIAWRAAPSNGVSFGRYNLIVCNFPSILTKYKEAGLRTAYFAPAHDPKMSDFASNTNRPIDLLFVGGYTRLHRRRAALLEAVAALNDRYRVAMHLDCSRMTRIAEGWPGRWLFPNRHRRPQAIRQVSREPVFGIELYSMLSRSKIVLNGAIDMAGSDRGNLRCFEAMGCGGLLLSDEGNYVDGMVAGQTLLTYRDPAEAVSQIEHALASPDAATIAARGHAMVAKSYSKERQWQLFQQLPL